MVAATIALTIGEDRRTFLYREGTVDEALVLQALKIGAYDVARLRRGAELIALYERLAAGGAPPLIVDTAAGIGAAAVFFAYKFPKARIVAIEEDPAKFELLAANTKGLAVECIEAVVVAERGTDVAGARVTIDDIYGRVSDARPFMVKLDVEADDLFAADSGWLQRTPVVVATLSDYLVPGTIASRRLVKHAAGWNRDFVFVEDNVFSLSRTPEPMPAAASI